MKRKYSYVVLHVKDYGGGHTEIVSQQVSKATLLPRKATGIYQETTTVPAIIHELKPQTWLVLFQLNTISVSK